MLRLSHNLMHRPSVSISFSLKFPGLFATDPTFTARIFSFSSSFWLSLRFIFGSFAPFLFLSCECFRTIQWIYTIMVWTMPAVLNNDAPKKKKKRRKTPSSINLWAKHSKSNLRMFLFSFLIRLLFWIFTTLRCIFFCDLCGVCVLHRTPWTQFSVAFCS